VGWKLTDRERDSVLALPAGRRYGYFIKRAASHGAVWSLRADDGWTVAEDDEGRGMLPVWPHRDYAVACANGPWDGAAPTSIDIDTFVTSSLAQLERDDMLVLVFPAEDQGEEVGTARLRRDLEAELERFGR
jgi:hypothetical protein